MAAQDCGMQNCHGPAGKNRLAGTGAGDEEEDDRATEEEAGGRRRTTRLMTMFMFMMITNDHDENADGD